MKRVLWAWCSLSLAAVLLAGCSGGDGNATPTPSQNSSTPIGAAGGTAATSDDIARAVFPAGVFSSTTNVTIASATGLPTSATSAAAARLVSGTAFTFGPSGNFSKPVTLTIKYDPASLPAGALESQLQLYKVVGNDWQPVVGGSVDTTAKTITAPVNDFSSYGVLANNQFTGNYTGTYSGGSSGTWQATIDVNGALTATATGGFTGNGTVGFNGSSSIGLNGSGQTADEHITFSGTFTLQNDGTVKAQGTWSSSSGNSGTWTGGK